MYTLSFVIIGFPFWCTCLNLFYIKNISNTFLHAVLRWHKNAYCFWKTLGSHSMRTFYTQINSCTRCALWWPTSCPPLLGILTNDSYFTAHLWLIFHSYHVYNALYVTNDICIYRSRFESLYTYNSYHKFYGSISKSRFYIKRQINRFMKQQVYYNYVIK